VTGRASQILEDALTLPRAERAQLAEQLLTSLEPPSREEIDEFWVREAEARLDAYKRGETQAIPAKDVLDELRKKYER